MDRGYQARVFLIFEFVLPTVANFKKFGKTPKDSEQSKIYARLGAIISATYFNKNISIPLKPEEFLFFTLLMSDSNY